MPSFYEFFAGGGMARAGLGREWTCLRANDIDKKKVACYNRNWPSPAGEQVLIQRDVGELTTSDLPQTADLAWASFPCQDLSLAGLGAGLKGSRSGTFWPFWNLISGLRTENRHPKTVVLENVCGALTSHGGRDFRSLIRALREEGYRAGALVINASLFLPQSRPRLFIVGIQQDIEIDPSLVLRGPQPPFHTAAVNKAFESLSPSDREAWIWWNLSPPRVTVRGFSEIIFDDGVGWNTREQTLALLGMMSQVNLAKVEVAKKMGIRVVGTVYKRTRPEEDGLRRQRAEVRFDDVAGCLRTPGGGSSRQTILVVEGKSVRSRLLSAREAARLMGLSEGYILPENYNDAYHLLGDGVAVPVVRHLASNILEPLLLEGRIQPERAA